MSGTWNEREIFLPDVVKNMHHRIGFRDVCNRMARQDSLHCPVEHFPLLRTPKIIDHQEPAPQKIFPQPAGFGLGQVPPSCLRRINPGVVKEPVVSYPEVTRVAGIDSRQPLDARCEVIVRGGPIHQPPAGSFSLARRISPAPVVLGQVRILHAKKMELGVAPGERSLVVIRRPKPPSLSQPRNRDQCQRSHSRAASNDSVRHLSIIVEQHAHSADVEQSCA